MRLVLSVLALLGVCLWAAPAAAQMPKNEINWQRTWRDLAQSQHSVKDSLLRTLERCAGPSIEPEEIKVYQYDINKDGLEDYGVDLRAIGRDVKRDTCDDLPCVGPDCYQWHYINKAEGMQQIILAKKPGDPNCPAKIEDNTQCYAHCPALIEKCPLLFRDVFYIAWNGRASAWNLYRTDALPQGRSLRPDPQGSHVLALTLHERDTLCSDTEMVQNGGKCIKYYQWDGTRRILVDIYRPVLTNPGTWPQADRHNFDRWNRDTMKTTKGTRLNDGYGFRLEPTPSGQNYNLAVNAKLNNAWTCLDIKNTSNKDYFVPNNTTEEFDAFYNHMPRGVSVEVCERRYTAWGGQPILAPLLGKDTELTANYCAYLAADIPCDTSAVITVTRECEASLGMPLDCSQCNADVRIPAGQRRLGCGQSITCYGPTCPTIGSSDGGSDGGGGDGGGN